MINPSYVKCLIKCVNEEFAILIKISSNGVGMVGIQDQEGRSILGIYSLKARQGCFHEQ